MILVDGQHKESFTLFIKLSCVELRNFKQYPSEKIGIRSKYQIVLVVTPGISHPELMDVIEH